MTDEPDETELNQKTLPSKNFGPRLVKHMYVDWSKADELWLRLVHAHEEPLEVCVVVGEKLSAAEAATIQAIIERDTLRILYQHACDVEREHHAMLEKALAALAK